MSEQIDNAKTILEAGKGLAAKVQEVSGLPCIVTPTGAQPLVDVIRIADERAERPRRRRGAAELQSVASFVEHVLRFKSGESAVFANAKDRTFTAVFNYHPAGADSPPAWGDHRSVYACPLSTEWKAWGGGADLGATQDGFATFLVKRERDLAVNAGSSPDKPYPSPADLMTLAGTLETYSSMKSKRDRDIRTGRVSVSFSEESGVKGNVVIPAAFGIRIPIFEDADPVLVEVSLRVEVVEGAARFVIGITDAEKVLRSAFTGLVERVHRDTELTVFVGTPEK